MPGPRPTWARVSSTGLEAQSRWGRKSCGCPNRGPVGAPSFFSADVTKVSLRRNFAVICPIERAVTLWGDTMKLMTLFANMCCAHWLYLYFNQHQPDRDFLTDRALAHRFASLIAPIFYLLPHDCFYLHGYFVTGTTSGFNESHQRRTAQSVRW